jgi:hypothetical protein
VADIKKQIRSGEISPLKGGWIMNSAAVFSHATGDAGSAKDGFDMNYGVNALGPMLLVMELLEVLEGGIVANRASMSTNNGMVGYALQRRWDDVSTIFYLSFSDITDPVQTNYI